MGHIKRRLTGQLRIVLAYLIEHGTITNREAILTLGVGRLASRTSELRTLGVVIVTSYPEAGKRHGEYSLGDKEAARNLLAAEAPLNITAAEKIEDTPEGPYKRTTHEGTSPVHPSKWAATGVKGERAAGGRR